MAPSPAVSPIRPAESSLYEAEPGDRVRFLGQTWTVFAVLFARDGRRFFSIDSDAGEHDCIAADGSDGGYQLLAREAQAPAPPLAARDSDQAQSAGRRVCIGSLHIRGDEPAAELAETLAPSAAAIATGSGHAGPGEPGSGSSMSPVETAGPVPIADHRFAPRAWRP